MSLEGPETIQSQVQAEFQAESAKRDRAIALINEEVGSINGEIITLNDTRAAQLGELALKALGVVKNACRHDPDGIDLEAALGVMTLLHGLDSTQTIQAEAILAERFGNNQQKPKTQSPLLNPIAPGGVSK